MKKRQPKRHSVIARISVLAVSIYLLYSLGTLQAQLTADVNSLSDLKKQKSEMELKIAELERLLEEGTEAEIIEKAVEGHDSSVSDQKR